MLFKSQIFTQVSGSIGGTTFLHGRSGLIARARTIPVDPGTPAQIAVRGAMADLATRWGSSLSQSQRNAWDVYAFNVTLLNPLGDAINVSGINMYIRSNLERLNFGQALVDAAPTTFDLGNDINPTTAVFSEAAQTASLIWAAGVPAWFAEDDAFAYGYMSRPMSPGIRFFKGPWQNSVVLEGDNAIPLASPQAVGAPFAFVEGQRMGVRLTVSRPDGRRTSQWLFNAIAVA